MTVTSPNELLAKAKKHDRFNEFLIEILNGLNHVVAGTILIIGGVAAFFAFTNAVSKKMLVALSLRL